MDRNNENNSGILNPANFRENGNRRALMDIKNIVGAPPYLCAVTKKELTDVNFADAKRPIFSPRRQIRKFAGSLTSNSQPFPQGIGGRHGPIGNERRKRPISIVVDSDGLDSYTAIDVDDLRLVHDRPLPKVDEMDEMVNGELKEVEMEDLVADPFVDIDMCDIKDPLAVVDYVEDIYSFYRENEVASCVSPEYMNNQFDINNKMRAILIDWLIEVHYKFELMDETLYLTVNIIDRFLEKQAVVRKKLQLVGVTAMFLACKYEEVSVPVVEDLIQISDRAYTRQEVLEMEKLIVNTLQFNMSVPTPYVFMRRYLKAAESDKKLELLSFFIIELCLVEHQTLKFRPSMLAAAAIYTAQCTIKGFKHWTSTSELYTSYLEDQLLECSRMMVEFHQTARDGKLTAAFRKYSTFKFGFAAKSEPALFLLNTRF